MFDKETLLYVEKKIKLENRGFLEKAYLQELILSEFVKTNIFFVFKGGTALYKLYKLSRFSEDLDFCVKDLDLASNTIKKIIEKNKWSFTAKKIYDTVLFRLSFKGPLVRDNTLRIDLSLSKSFSYSPKTIDPIFIDFKPFMINVMNLDEILVEKTSAVTNREKARDLYDIYFLSKLVDFSADLWITKFGDTFIDVDKFEHKREFIKADWKKLNTYVLNELPDFDLVYPLVVEKLNAFNNMLKEKKKEKKNKN